MGVYDEGNQAQKQRKSIFIKHILFTAQYGLRALGYLRIIIISTHRAMMNTQNYHGVRIHYIQLRTETAQGIGYSHFFIAEEKLRMYATYQFASGDIEDSILTLFSIEGSVEM